MYKKVGSECENVGRFYEIKLPDMPNIEPFPACLLMTHLPGYVLNHHNQGVVEQKTSRSLAKIFSEGEQISVPISLFQILLFLSICSWKLRCLSKITLKCFCDSYI